MRSTGITSIILTSTSVTRTSPSSLIDLTRPNDKIVGLYNTQAGQSTGGFNGRYSTKNETPLNAIDNNVATKYLNYGNNGSDTTTYPQPGKGTGFFIIPSISNATVARAVLFATANDHEERDPLIITLEGSNATTNTTLHLGSSWTLIYNGSTGISAVNIPNRSTYMTPQIFSNTRVFASYRLLVVSQRNDSNSVQYSEAHILGYY